MSKEIIDCTKVNNVELLQREIKFVEEQMKFHGITIDNVEQKQQDGKHQWLDKRNNFVILEKVIEPELLTITYTKYFNKK